MKQLTRELYSNGRVWVSLIHSFTYTPSGGNETALIKISKDYVTLRSGAMLLLTFWSPSSRQPEKFNIPEYKIEEFRLILKTLRDLKTDPGYVRDNELTDKGKASSLYYRLSLANKSYFDVYFTENEYAGEKTVNITIELESKNSYYLYDSNVIDLIELIPSVPEIARYKQSAAELYYMDNLMNGSRYAPNQRGNSYTERSEPKTINVVDRTIESVNEDHGVRAEETVVTPRVQEKTPEVKNTNTEVKSAPTSSTGFDYNNLLSDE